MISDVDDMNTIFTGDFVKSVLKSKGRKSHLFLSFFCIYLSIYFLFFIVGGGGRILLFFARFIEKYGIFL